MTAAWSWLGAWALCGSGMAALSLAMDRHHQQLTGRHEVPRLRRITLRVLGCLLLALALRHCLVHWGPSVGWVAWCGFLSAGAWSVALLLASWPKRRSARAE